VGSGMRLARQALMVAVAIGGLASCAEASTTIIGTLHLPSSEQAKTSGARKLLLVRGHLMTGDVPVAIVDGKLWFGRVCAECDVQPIKPVSAREARHIDPARLSPQAVAMLSDNPWVRKRIARRADVRQVVAEYVAAQDDMMDAIESAYQHALDSHAPSPQDSGCAKIDPEIAVAEPNGPRSPRFSPGGSFSVFIHGFGYRGVELDRGTPPPRAVTTVDLLARAQGRFQNLEFMLGLSVPTLMVITKTADLTMTGADATAALDLIDRVLANPMVPIEVNEGDNRSGGLPRTVLEEIQQVALQAKSR